jgi:uncharacterized protein (TIGR03089 family)
MTPERSFAELLQRDPARPFVTYYDEATGERSELSVRSLANWVAKTHHLLGTELGLGTGDTVLVSLPAHWISVPVVLGCLTAGLRFADGSDPAADVAFVTPETLTRADGVPEVYAIAPGSAATGFGDDPPPGTQDYVSAVRPHEDAWAGVRLAAGPDDPCWGGRTRHQVAEAAIDRAAALGLGPGARLLSTREWDGPADWVDTLLAPLAVGGSVVYVRNCADPAVLERRAGQERATARA